MNRSCLWLVLAAGLVVLRSAGAQTLVTWDFRVYEEAVRKAKELGCRPVVVTVVDDGTMFFITAGPRIAKADASQLKDGDMVVAGCAKQVRLEGLVLEKGEYAVRKNGKLAKASTRLGAAPETAPTSTAATSGVPATAAASASKDAPARTWRDRNGRAVEAAFLGCEAGKLRLQRTRDGQVFEVPLAALSDEDQAFVRAQSPEVAKLRLEVKFTPGSYVLTEVLNSATEITAEGQRQKMGDAMTVGGGVIISAPAASGEQTVRFVCRQIKSETSLPGMTMRFDSQGPEEEQHQLLASVLRPLLGWEGVLTVRDGKFVKVDGVEHLISKMQASLPPEAAPLADKLKTQMQEFLKEMLTRHWAQILPHGPVGPGDAWQAKLQVRSIPVLGEMTFDCDCLLDGVEEAAGGKVAVWSFKCKSAVEDRPMDLGGLVPPGVQAKIQRMTVNQTGRARFDTRIGLSVQATLDSQIDGELSVRAPDGQSGIVKLQVTAKYQNTLTPDDGSGPPSSASAAGSGAGHADRQSSDAAKPSAGQGGPPVRDIPPPAAAREPGPPKYCVFEGMKLRKDPNASAEETGKLRAGEEVDVREVQASWCRVKTAQAEGWVHKMALTDSAELAQRIGALRPQPNALFVLSELKGPGSCACEIHHGGLKLAAPGQELRMAAGNCLAVEKCDYRAPFSIFGKTIEPLRFDTLYWLNGQDRLVPVLDVVRADKPEANPPSASAKPAASAPSAESRGSLPPVNAGDWSLPDEAREAFVLVRSAELREAASFDAKELGSVAFGTKLTVQQRRGDWARVSTSGDRPLTGHVHVCQLAASEAATEMLLEAGLVPHSLLCSEPSTPGDLKMRLIGGNVEVRTSSGKPDGEVQRMRFQPGDGLWFAGDDELRQARAKTFESIGAKTPSAALRPKTLYALTPTMDLLPLEQAAAQAIAEPNRQIPGMLAFKAPVQLCPQPVDAWWFDSGEVLVVADAQRGVVLLKVDPLRRAYQLEEPTTLAGGPPAFLAPHAKMLVVGWKGNPSGLRSYRFVNGALQQGAAMELPAPPVSWDEYGSGEAVSLLIGTEDGRLLEVDFRNHKLTPEARVFDTPVRQIVVTEKQAWVVGGTGGLRLFERSDDGAWSQKAALNRRVDRVILTREGERPGLLLFSESAGPAWLPCENAEKLTPAPLAGCASTRAHAAAAYAPPEGGFSLAGKEKDYLVAASGPDGIQLLRGEEPSRMSPWRQVRLPSAKLIWGVELAAVLSDDGLWFVSLSELLPPDYRARLYSLAGGAEIGFTLNGLEIVRGTAYGVDGMKERDPLASLPERYRTEKLGNRLTLWENPEGTILTGWWMIERQSTYHFSPETQITVGRTGATIRGVRYRGGEILQLDSQGQPIRVGRWPGTSVLKHAESTPAAPAPLATTAPGPTDEPKAKAEAEAEALTAVVGVTGPVELYPDADLEKEKMAEIEGGTTVNVLETRECAVRVKTKSGQEGWLRRCWLCTAKEYERRKSAGEVPRQAICIGSVEGKTAFYGGGLSIENSQIVMKPGDSFWMDPTMKGKNFNFGGESVAGDPAVLLLKPERGNMIRLPIFQPDDEGTRPGTARLECDVFSFLVQDEHAPGLMPDDKEYFIITVAAQVTATADDLKAKFGSPAKIEPGVKYDSMARGQAVPESHQGDLWLYGRVGVLIENGKATVVVRRARVEGTGEDARKRSMLEAMNIGLPHKGDGPTDSETARGNRAAPPAAGGEHVLLDRIAQEHFADGGKTTREDIRVLQDAVAIGIDASGLPYTRRSDFVWTPRISKDVKVVRVCLLHCDYAKVLVKQGDKELWQYSSTEVADKVVSPDLAVEPRSEPTEPAITIQVTDVGSGPIKGGVASIELQTPNGKNGKCGGQLEQEDNRHVDTSLSVGWHAVDGGSFGLCQPQSEGARNGCRAADNVSGSATAPRRFHA